MVIGLYFWSSPLSKSNLQELKGLLEFLSEIDFDRFSKPGVVLINEPTAYSKILGENTPQLEALIQRGATASWAPKNLGSKLIMFACRWMIKNTEKRAFISYADPSANEIGIIYQAAGFEYLGNNLKFFSI